MFVSGKTEKILLPRFDTIGDLILLEPFLTALQEVFRGAKISLLVREGYEQLAPLFPDGLGWRAWRVNPFSRPADPIVLKDLIKSLENEDWDLIVFTKYEHTWLEYLIGAWFNNLKRLVISPMETFPNWLQPYLGALGINSELSPCELVSVKETIHESDKYQILINYIVGEKKTLPSPKLTVPSISKKNSLEIIRSLGLSGKPFCACLPGGTENIAIKKWPSETFSKVIAWLRRKYLIETLLIGNEIERGIIEEVASLASAKGYHPSIWFGKQGELPILAGILEQAKFYFGNDTGPMHMSAALGIPVVALFGGGTWPRFIPKTSEGHVVVRPMPCFYCGWKCSFGDAPCIKDLPISLVQKALKTVLEKDEFNQDEISIHKAKPYSKIADRFIYQSSEVFKRSEADREARLEVIYGCEQRIEEINQDREARLKVIEDLGRRLEQSEAKRAGVVSSLEDLTRRFEESEADRAARLEVIRDCERQIKGVEGEREGLLRQVEELERCLEQKETERVGVLKAAEELERRLQESEADRAARLEVIREFERQIRQINQDKEARLKQVEDLGRRLEQRQAEMTAMLSRIEGLQRRIEENETDLETHRKVLEDLRKRLEDSERDRVAQLDIIRDREQRIEEISQDRAARLKVIEEQGNELEAQRAHIETLKESIKLIKSSLSWKITGPFRRLHDHF